MPHFLLRSILIALALVAFSSFLDATTSTASAQRRARGVCLNCGQNHHGSPDLFYNFYAQANCGGIAAQMYVSPGPVPASVRIADPPDAMLLPDASCSSCACGHLDFLRCFRFLTASNR